MESFMNKFCLTTIILLSLIVGWFVVQPFTASYQRFERVNVIQEQWGIASWYDYKFIQDLEWKDGIGEVVEVAVPCFAWEDKCYTHDKLYAASRKFERGTMLKVTNLANHKSIEVRVTDYIEHPERIIDLTSYAFSQIADLKLGLVDVRIEEIEVIEELLSL